MASEQNSVLADLAEERIRLEREKLEIERGRLEAARAALQNSAGLRNPPGRTWAIAGGIATLVLISFACGTLFGSAVSRSRDDASRERRLAQTLSRLGALTANATNDVDGARRDVSVLVIQ